MYALKSNHFTLRLTINILLSPYILGTAMAMFELLVTNCFTGFQHQKCPVSWVQVKCVGHWWSATNSTILEELLWTYRCPCKPV